MSNRTYSSALNDGKGAPTFQYIWDASLVTSGAGRPQTGNWRIFTTSDIGTANLSVSGLSLTVGAVAVTGIVPVTIAGGSITVVNPLLATSGNVTIINTAPIPFSGVVVANTVDTGVRAVTMTGTQVTIPYTAPVYVTGSFATTSTSAVSITGFSPTLPPLPVSGSFTATPGNTAITGFNSTIAPLAISGIVTAAVSTVDTGNRSVFLVNQAVVNSGGWVGVTGQISIANQATVNSGGWVGITGGVNVLNQATINSGGWVGITGFSSLIAPLAVSGTFTANIGNVAVTGGQVSITGGTVTVIDTTSWALLSGISGALTANLSGAAWVTGQISVTNQATVNSGGWVGITGFSSLIAPLAVSGSFAATIGNVAVTGGNLNVNVTNQATVNSGGWVGITGFSATIAPLAVSGSFTANPGNTTVTGFPATIAPLAISGVVQTNVTVNATGLQIGTVAVTGVVTDQITGWNTGIVVSYQPVTRTTSSNSTPSGIGPWTGMATPINISTGQILAANTNRVMFFIQNIHTGTPLYVNLGVQAVSTGVFSFILNPSATQGFGGSSFSDDHYRGAVTVSGGAWTAWEL